MSEAKPTGNRAPWPPLAPLNWLGRALGFRWIMPFGTLPLPFHPWLARLLPFLIPAYVLYRTILAATGESGGSGWPWLLIVAGLLALPMAIPIVSWIALAFRVPLLQGLLVAGAMVLVIVDIATGAAPLWLAALPAGWVGLYLIQRIGGPIYLRSLQAANTAFGPVTPGARLLIVEQDKGPSNHAGWLMRNHDLARVAYDGGAPNSRDAATYLRLAPGDYAAVAERVKRIKPQGWSLGADHVGVPGLRDSHMEPPLRVSIAKHRAPLWLIAGPRTKLTIDDGDTAHRLVGGEASVVGAIPLFTCFYWLSIFGGRSQWVTGFAREKPVQLGTARVYDMFAQAFLPLGPSPSVTVDATPLLAELDAMDIAQTQAAHAALTRLLDLEADYPDQPNVLLRRPDIVFGQGRTLCTTLTAAKDAKDGPRVVMCAELLSRLPEVEFRALSAELLKLLDSKALAFRLIDSKEALDLPERERSAHVIGGFELVRRVPRLYERLGELGEPARALVMAMGELGRWPRALEKARDRLDGKDLEYR